MFFFHHMLFILYRPGNQPASSSQAAIPGLLRSKKSDSNRSQTQSSYHQEDGPGNIGSSRIVKILFCFVLFCFVVKELLASCGGLSIVVVLCSFCVRHIFSSSSCNVICSLLIMQPLFSPSPHTAYVY